MAVFAIVADDSEDKKQLKYINKSDLLGLIGYTCRKSKYTVPTNLYDFGNYDMFSHQMLYLQDCKGSVLKTRALHFVLSFNVHEFRERDKLAEAMRCVSWFGTFYFNEYQSICCLHDDKHGRFDIHYIINPVNVKNYKIFHWSVNDYSEWLKDVAKCLFYNHKIALLGTSYIDEKGVMHLVNDSELYQDQLIKLF